MEPSAAPIDLHLVKRQEIQIFRRDRRFPENLTGETLVTPGLSSCGLSPKQLAQFRFIHPTRGEPITYQVHDNSWCILDLDRSGTMVITEHAGNNGLAYEDPDYAECLQAYTTLIPKEHVDAVLTIWRQHAIRYSTELRAYETIHKRRAEEDRQIKRLLAELQLDEESYKQRIDALLRTHGLDKASIQAEVEAALVKADLGTAAREARDKVMVEATFPTIRERYPDLFPEPSNA